METRICYGEYTLRHWLELILTRNVVLPDYQRSFVWEDTDVKRLINSLQSGQFIPPVTIAHFVNKEQADNLILDGQQRLTSILLAYLGYVPIKEKFQESEDGLAVGDDSNEDGDAVRSIEWTFNLLLDEDPRKNTLPLIIERLRGDERYEKLDLVFPEGPEKFYDNTFLGFSFVLPSSPDAYEMQKYFSTLFRNMNYLGRRLSPLESRRSLYYLNAEYKNYFDGKLVGGEDILCSIRIKENLQARKIDLVRYLSTLSQFVGLNDMKQVLKGYSAYSSRESYYADYVSYVVGLEQESRIDKFRGFVFKDQFPNNEWQDRYVLVKSFFERNLDGLGLDNKTTFTSWIDADYWLYGLLYWVVFNGKTITRDEELVVMIKERVEAKRKPVEGNDYAKNPNRVGNLRERIQESIAIFAHYAE